MIQAQHTIREPKQRLPTMLYRFTLHGGNTFYSRFTQPVIRLNPSYMNGKPLDIAVDTIISIQRVNDPGWLISQRLKHFLFELDGGVKLSGIPDEKVCLVDIMILQDGKVSSIFRDCRVEFENIREVKLVTNRRTPDPQTLK